MNLVEPIAVASFGAGAAATAVLLLGSSAPWATLAAVPGALVAVLVLARASAAPTAVARRASAAVAALAFLAFVGVVAALRVPARGAPGLLAWELAKVAGVLLAGGLGVAAAAFGLLAAAGRLLARTRAARREPSP